jgi:polynucleotide 5'-kinase involved in rRNA processing
VLSPKALNISSTIKPIFKKPFEPKSVKKSVYIKKTIPTMSNDLMESLQKMNLSNNTVNIHCKSVCEPIEERKNSLEPLGIVVIGDVDSGTLILYIYLLLIL